MIYEEVKYEDNIIDAAISWKLPAHRRVVSNSARGTISRGQPVGRWPTSYVPRLTEGLLTRTVRPAESSL